MLKLARYPNFLMLAHPYLEELKTGNRDPSLVINFKNGEGNSPLHLSTLQGYFKITKILLEHNASLNLENKKGKTPSQIQDEKGNSPLLLAAAQENIEMTRILLAHDAPLDLKNNEGNSPFHKLS